MKFGRRLSAGLHRRLEIGALAVCGLGLGALRATWFAPRHGITDDFRAFELTAALALDGVNVYAATDVYRYGPGWQVVLWLIGQFAVPGSEFFRVLTVSSLTLADIGIAWCLTRLTGGVAGWLFLLNPISMIISGFHLQFDNIALMLGCGAILLTTKSGATRRSDAWGDVLLGTSLVTKHLLVVLPLWSIVRPDRSRGRLWYLTPVLIFGASFVPWALSAAGRDGIIQDVLMFRSGREVALLGRFGESVEENLRWLSGLYGTITLLALVGVGWLVRHHDVVTAFFTYVLAAFAFSPGLSNQQLVVLLLALIGLRSRAAIPVMLYGWLFLTVHPDGLNVMSDPFSWFTSHFPTRLYDVMIALEYSPFIVVALVVLAGQLRRAPATRGA